MHIEEKEIKIPKSKSKKGLLEYISQEVLERLSQRKIPVRFVITRTEIKNYHCEVAILNDIDNFQLPSKNSIFSFNNSLSQNSNLF